MKDCSKLVHNSVNSNREIYKIISKIINHKSKIFKDWSRLLINHNIPFCIYLLKVNFWKYQNTIFSSFYHSFILSKNPWRFSMLLYSYISTILAVILKFMYHSIFFFWRITEKNYPVSVMNEFIRNESINWVKISFLAFLFKNHYFKNS